VALVVLALVPAATLLVVILVARTVTRIAALVVILCVTLTAAANVVLLALLRGFSHAVETKRTAQERAQHQASIRQCAEYLGQGVELRILHGRTS